MARIALGPLKSPLTGTRRFFSCSAFTNWKFSSVDRKLCGYPLSSYAHPVSSANMPAVPPPPNPAARRTIRTIPDECGTDGFELGGFGGGEGEPVRSRQVIDDADGVLRRQFAIGSDRPVGVPDALDRCRVVEVRRPRLREQQRDEVRSIRRELEDGLEHQVLHHRLSPDIDDEGQGGTDRRDVRQVLL